MSLPGIAGALVWIIIIVILVIILIFVLGYVLMVAPLVHAERFIITAGIMVDCPNNFTKANASVLYCNMIDSRMIINDVPIARETKVPGPHVKGQFGGA